jgi:uncharacterized protein YjbI with pentapeptide repeats
MESENSPGYSPPGGNSPQQSNGDGIAEVAIRTNDNPKPSEAEITSRFPALYGKGSKLTSAVDMVGDIRHEAAELRNFTISYLSLLLFVNFIIGSTTHEQILLVTPVTLPLLNVELPIVGFFAFMPWVLFFFHMYVLVQHYLFSQHLFHFIWALRKEKPANRDYLRRSLGNLPFLHWMAGDHHVLMQLLLTVITLVLLIFWPLVTLLWLQMGFLPYHDETITWWQRGAIILDVLLLAWIWPTTLDWKDKGLRWWLKIFPLSGLWLCSRLKISRRLLRSGKDKKRILYFIGQGSALFLRYILPVPVFGALLLSTLFLSVFVATIPDSPEEDWERKHFSAWFPSVDSKDTRSAFILTAWLHEQHPKLVEPTSEEYGDLRSQGAADCPEQEQGMNTNGEAGDAGVTDKTEKETSVCLMVQPRFPRNLIVRERVITANNPLNPDLESAFLSQSATLEPKVLAEIRGADLSDRNLKYADFYRSAFPKADLRRAKLRSANLAMSKLNQADMRGAHLIGADMAQAKLPGANLSQAKLPGADLIRAELSGANLTRAELTGANLTQAKLPGADLTLAKLPGANLIKAELPGANLTRAELSGADLTGAKLPGADLTRAKLAGADFTGVELPGALLVGIKYAGLLQDSAASLAGTFRSALGDLSKYGEEQGQRLLDEDVENFRQQISKPANLAISLAPDGVPCLRDSALADSEPKSCLPEPVALKRPEIFMFWRKLACQDATEQRWIAQAMVQRAIDQRRKGREQFSQILQQAALNAKTCPGLSGLPDETADFAVPH